MADQLFSKNLPQSSSFHSEEVEQVSTQLQNALISFRPVIHALIAWVFAFGLAIVLQPYLPAIPRSLAYFLSSTVLIALSFFWVVAFSKLALHRALYLTIGAIGLVLVLVTARPLVNRTASIEKAASITGNSILWVSAHAFKFQNEIIIQTRNEIHEKVSDFLDECLPESRFRIFVLCLAQLLLASGIGLWIGNGIDDKSHIIPIALVATLADTWSVAKGATALIVRSSQIHYFLLRFPLLGGGSVDLPFLIGLTDFLFFGIYFQAALRFKLGIIKNVALLGIGFLLTVGAAILFSTGLPVLPLISILFVLGNLRELHLNRNDIKTIVLLLGAMAVSFWLFSRLSHYFQ